jgi:hypothetical protein
VPSTRRSLPPPPAPPATEISIFYSIQMNAFLRPQIFQLQENTALHFFYSVQMNGLRSKFTVLEFYHSGSN